MMRHVPEPTGLRWIGCLIGLVWTPKSTSNMLTPKGTFTRDEWSHLLRFFNIMNFSMFSCSHFLSMKKGEHHVEQSSGKKDRRRACGGEIEASEFYIKKFERESISHVGFGYIPQPGELRTGLEFGSHKH